MAHAKNKTVAVWLALVGGSLGLHRFYLVAYHREDHPKLVVMAPIKVSANFKSFYVGMNT